MDWIPFFGSNEDDEGESPDDGDVQIVSNVDASNINVLGAESTSSRSTSGGLSVHTISLSDGPTGSDQSTTTDPESPRASTRRTGPSSGTEPSTPSAPETGPSTPSAPETGPSTPSAPDGTPSPSSDPVSRGTFVVPDDKHFLQKVEARGKNGHGSIVETVYVLTGPTYTRPTDLIRLDNEAYYSSATRTSVSFDPRAMANKVASLFPEDEGPKLIARFHTHPGGTLRPSSADKSSAHPVRSAFEQAFGTDDFEFFHGIHGLEEHGRSPPPDERQNPAVSGSHVEWLGERYRHKLAVFGEGFEPRRDVHID